MNKDLTATQNDYAVFLPATSGFYATFIGKQRYSNYVDPARLPTSFTNGVESLNYLEPEKGLFYYNWCLYSAGHANLDISKQDEAEDMFRNRDRTTSWVLGDSGGFQIGKGVWEGDWKNPNCPKAQKKREQVLAWMDAYMDYGMCLDIPAWVCRSPEGQKATGIRTYEEAVDATYINNEYFVNNRNGNCKFLNVLQGENHAQADDWYNRMKKYCDPNIYGDKAFNGWAMGGQNMCDVHLILKRLVTLRFDGLLEQGKQDWMHFLGTSKLEWAVLLTDIQRAVRKYHNPNFTISFDCASPFLATANGQIYIQTETKDREKWVYRMVPSADNKKYSSDTRLFKDAVVQDKLFKKKSNSNEFYGFESSPLIDQVEMKDVCIYSAGVPNPTLPKNVTPDPYNPDHWEVLPSYNKLGKVSERTSWDSFSYAIQMGHNVWHHINAVQEANRQYDIDVRPSMLIRDGLVKTEYFRNLVDEIFQIDDFDKAMALVEENEKYWDTIIGTRGNTGKRLMNSSTNFHNLFEEVPQEESDDDFETDPDNFSEEKLDKLEEELRNET